MLTSIKKNSFSFLAAIVLNMGFDPQNPQNPFLYTISSRTAHTAPEGTIILLLASGFK